MLLFIRINLSLSYQHIVSLHVNQCTQHGQAIAGFRIMLPEPLSHEN